MVIIADQVKLNELAIKRDELYSELIDIAEANDYDIDEIESINHEIAELDEKTLAVSTKYVPSLMKLI